MDPLSALAVASAVVQFVKVGIEVSKKLAEYSEMAPGETPRSLKSINTRLPLLINALSRIQNESDVDGYDPEIRSILHGVVTGCLKLVRELDDIAVKIRPKAGESLTTKLKKVFGSLKIEDRVEDIDLGLQGYISVLILHRVVDRATAQTLPLEESRYFEVKEKRITDPIARNELISQLDQAFYEAARGQKQIPEYVILLGEEQTGKSQLALTYCHQAYEVGQFQTIFWLDASTPTSLRLGLEAAASAVRRTKTGTPEEKTKYLFDFLSERWHPWLLVLDNYQPKEFNRESVTQLLPQTGNGAVLVTTRDYDMPPMGLVIKVHKARTPEEETSLRYKATIALHKKDLDAVKDALDQGLKVDSFSHSVWGRDGEPLVNIAAEAGFNDGLQLFLDLGANPHLGRSMHAVLASAVRSQDISTVALYLDHEDKTGKQLSEDNYDWAFQVALQQGDVPILNILLERRDYCFKADSVRTREGFVKAAETGDVDILRLLHKVKYFPANKFARAGALCKAIDNKHLDMVKFLLKDVEISPEEPDEFGESALYHAVSIGRDNQDAAIRDEIVTLLLEAGASPNTVTRSNRTPLHRGAAYGCISTMKLLLQHGADVQIETEEGTTPLMMAVDWKAPQSYPLLTGIKIADPDAELAYYSRPLFEAARTGDRELVMLLMKKQGILNMVEKSTGDTALLAAVREKQVAMARMLIRNKPNQQILDKDGKIAVLLAAEQGLELVIRDLSKAADFPGLEVCDGKGYTPLMLAAQSDHQKAVKVLLDLGADRDAVNQFGETALDIAEEKDLEKVVKMLSNV